MARWRCWSSSAVSYRRGVFIRTRETVSIPADRSLNGVWQCYFLKAKGKIEKNYYSVWAFEAAKKRVHILESGP